MANIFELNINLNSTEETETEKALKKTSNSKTAASEDDSENAILAALKSAGKAAAAVVSIQKVKSDVVMPLLNMNTTKIGTIYGDVARQNQIQNLTNTVNMGIGMVQTGLTGYSIGKTAGGSKGGGTAGAVIAIVLDVVGKSIDMITNAMEYNNKQQDHKYDAAYSQEQLGLLAANKGR